MRRNGKKKDNPQGEAKPNVTETSRIQIARRLEQFRAGDEEGIILQRSSSLCFFFFFLLSIESFNFFDWVLVLFLGRLLLAVGIDVPQEI